MKNDLGEIKKLLQKLGVEIEPLNALDEQGMRKIQLLFRIFRQMKFVSQAKAGKIIGFGQSYVSRFERGRYMLSGNQWKNVLHLLADWARLIDPDRQQLALQETCKHYAEEIQERRRNKKKHLQSKANLTSNILAKLTPHLQESDNKSNLEDLLAKCTMPELVSIFFICQLLSNTP